MNRQKQLKTILINKKLRETTNLCVEIMNSKRQEKGKLKKFAFAVRRNRDA